VVAPNPAATPPAYNDLFERLVLSTEDDSSDRIIGLLTYALYKQRKQEWCKAFHDKHGRDPNGTEMGHYLLSYSDNVLDQLREQATTSLLVFADVMTEDTVEQARKEGVNNAMVKQLEAAGSWVKGISLNLAASAIFSVLIVLASAVWALTDNKSAAARIWHYLHAGEDAPPIPANGEVIQKESLKPK